jgi:hypothetical protein
MKHAANFCQIKAIIRSLLKKKHYVINDIKYLIQNGHIRDGRGHCAGHLWIVGCGVKDENFKNKREKKTKNTLVRLYPEKNSPDGLCFGI